MFRNYLNVNIKIIQNSASGLNNFANHMLTKEIIKTKKNFDINNPKKDLNSII